jgi:hypothetical protein
MAIKERAVAAVALWKEVREMHSTKGSLLTHTHPKIFISIKLDQIHSSFH